MPKIARAYVLAKNEVRNIARCLRSLQSVGIETVVLDSGSTDGTQDVASGIPGVTVQSFTYKDHCQSYNTITSWHSRDELVLILDADMQVSPELVRETEALFEGDSTLDVVRAPLLMYWDGAPLKYCNLCPPKGFAFRGGRELFRPAGHGEQLVDSVQVVQARNTLVHDDRKPLELVLANQWRYAKDTVRRGKRGNIRLKDWVRLNTPIYMIGMPLFALIFRRGLFAGKTGIVYALDRLIAEALTYRAALSSLVESELGEEQRNAS